MEDCGFAIIAGALMVALSLFFAFGAAVVVERSNLLHSAKIAQERIAARAHEDLRVTVNRDNAVIEVRNVGSTFSTVVALLVKNADNSLTVHDASFFVNVLGRHEFVWENSIPDDSTVGVLTSLGNAFWEEVE